MVFPRKRFLQRPRRIPSTTPRQYWVVVVVVVFLSSSKMAEGLSAASVKPALSTVPLQSIETTQLALLDGPEWLSIQTLQKDFIHKKDVMPNSKFGYMNIVVGKDAQGQSMIGIQSAFSDSNNNNDDDDKAKYHVYQDSLAKIPSKIKREDAIATYIAAVSTVHAVLPKAEQVGGSSEVTMIGGKVVVVGGNELACFAAEGLASLGVQVCLVSTGNPKVKPTKAGKVEIVKPAVGGNGIGFAAHVGTFDSLLDTIGNERSMNSVDARTTKSEEEDDDDDDEDSDSDPSFPSFSLDRSKSVLSLLSSRHNCYVYVSTVTQCQLLVAKEGILGGPRKADEYIRQIGQPATMVSSSGLGNSPCQPILPWSNLGSTVESLLTAGVIFSSRARENWHQKSKSIRGWTIGDFWEQSTWPRDSSGSAQIRFGLPVVEDPNLDEEPLLAEPPSSSRRAGTKKSLYGQFDFESKEDYLEDAPPPPVQENPFVLQVAGVQGVKSEIMEEEMDCILFLSAKFCKTCRAINPQYTRMARLGKETSRSIVFAKAETSGRWGKELGRYFGVEAVPAFLMFRKGQRFGSAMSVSKLPSRKIDRALELLESGAPWDPDVLRQDEKQP